MILLHLKKSYVMENFCFLLGSSVIAKQQQKKNVSIVIKLLHVLCHIILPILLLMTFYRLKTKLKCEKCFPSCSPSSVHGDPLSSQVLS